MFQVPLSPRHQVVVQYPPRSLAAATIVEAVLNRSRNITLVLPTRRRVVEPRSSSPGGTTNPGGRRILAGVTQAERPTLPYSVQKSTTTVASAEYRTAATAADPGAAAAVSGPMVSNPVTPSAADATTSSRRGGDDGHEPQQAERRRGRRREEEWAVGDGQGHGEVENKHKPPTLVRRSSTSTTDLPSPELPARELLSPWRRQSPTARPGAGTCPPERVVTDIWRDVSPAAAPQANASPNTGGSGHHGGDRWGDGRCGGGGGTGLDGEKRSSSVRELAAKFGGGIPPRKAGKTEYFSSAPPAKSLQTLGVGTRAALCAPPSSSLPDPPDQATQIQTSKRLELLRARTNGAGMSQDGTGGLGPGGESRAAAAGDGVPRPGDGDGRRGKDNEAAEKNLSASKNSSEESAASIRSGLTLSQNLNRGGLLSKSGSLRMMAAAGGGSGGGGGGGGNLQRSDATGRGRRDRTTASLPQRNHGGREGDKDTPARPPTSAIAAATTRTAAAGGAEVVERVDPEIPAVEETSNPQPRAGSDDHAPGPSPASVSGHSSPPAVERTRRSFFGSPREARGPGGGDGDGDGGGGGGGGGGCSGRRSDERSSAARTRPKTANAFPASGKAATTAPAAANAASSSGNGANNGRPKTSFAAAAAAAAASRDRRSVAASNFRRRPRPSTASPPSRLPDGGASTSRRRGTISGSSSTATVAAALAAATVALNPKTTSPVANDGTQHARPVT